MGGETAARKRVGRVAPTGNVLSDDVAISAYELRYESLENVVDMLVPAVPALPCFNNSLVVAMDEKSGVGLTEEE